MKNSDKVIRRIAHNLGRRRLVMPLLSALVAAIGLASMQARADVVHMQVFFDGDCPKGVSEPNLEVEKKNKTQINWVAYDMAGTAKVDKNFSIFFDPFKNSELKSRRGELMSPKLGDNDVPNAVYKYTILGDNCPDYPHDPHIRLR